MTTTNKTEWITRDEAKKRCTEYAAANGGKAEFHATSIQVRDAKGQLPLSFTQAWMDQVRAGETTKGTFRQIRGPQAGN
jgi:hypothetical protein